MNQSTDAVSQLFRVAFELAHTPGTFLAVSDDGFLGTKTISDDALQNDWYEMDGSAAWHIVNTCK
jgi:hypothetical protein